MLEMFVLSSGGTVPAVVRKLEDVRKRKKKLAWASFFKQRNL